jgi:two-component system, sensor histidine kinase
VAAYVRDIQERKALDAELQRRHDELQQARRQAEQASQAKSDFLANVNHEIRTPLNGVTAALSLLAMTELSDEQQEYLRILKSSSENLLRLVNEILDFSKLERGKLQLEKSTVTVRPWLSEVVNAFRHSAEAKGLRLELEVESGVPETLRVDPVRLSHVLRNLISNSIKFTDAGEIRLSLQLSQPANLRFQITDSGIGVPPELQRKIFQLFDQADTSSTRSYEGIGLGLTVADGLVRLMGGQLALTSEPGQGSRFHFEIRLELPEDALADPIQGNGRALDVLVVEDNPVNRRIMELMLQKLGHRATLARDAEDAFAAWEHQGFDVVLMDLQMPGMNGLDATREFRRREQQQGRPRVPIIALTGRALKHDREQCLASGMDDYFTKPIQAPQLSAALARLAPPGA